MPALVVKPPQREGLLLVPKGAQSPSIAHATEQIPVVVPTAKHVAPVEQSLLVEHA